MKRKKLLGQANAYALYSKKVSNKETILKRFINFLMIFRVRLNFRKCSDTQSRRSTVHRQLRHLAMVRLQKKGIHRTVPAAGEFSGTAV